MLYFKNGFRSFNTENLGSVGQRVSKLPAVKVGGHKKKSAIRPQPQSASLPGFEPRPTDLSGAGAGGQTFSCDLQL